MLMLMTTLLTCLYWLKWSAVLPSRKGSAHSQHAVVVTTLPTQHYTTYYSHKLGALRSLSALSSESSILTT